MTLKSCKVCLTHVFLVWTMVWDRHNPVEFSETHSSPVEASRHSKFISNKSFTGNWPILLNLAPKIGQEMAYFSQFLTKLLWKVGHYLLQIQKKTGWTCKGAVSLIIVLHGSKSELNKWEYSYKYNSPAGVAGLIRTLVTLSRNIIWKMCYYAMSQHHVYSVWIH